MKTTHHRAAGQRGPIERGIRLVKMSPAEEKQWRQFLETSRRYYLAKEELYDLRR
jgi:hypothetical protein